MSLLLSLETTTHSFSCALHNHDRLVASVEVTETQSTASKLAPAIESLFQENGLRKDQLSAVVVSSGPGSYTGLRIGTATAKGICYALNIPFISLNSLLLMAQEVIDLELKVETNALLCPMLDARRMEVYCMLLNPDLGVFKETEAKVLDENSFADLLENRDIFFFGDGSEKFKTIVKNSNAKFIEGVKPSASVLGRLGYQKFLSKQFENLAFYEPFYLKDFIIKKPNLVS